MFEYYNILEFRHPSLVANPDEAYTQHLFDDDDDDDENEIKLLDRRILGLLALLRCADILFIVILHALRSSKRNK